VTTGNRIAAQIVVIAKAPVPGRVKTRLTPPLRPDQAALLAEAALADTLDATARAPVTGRLLALDGTPGRWLPAGFDVTGQRGGGLDERIAAALGEAYARLPLPVALIGMDTPQVTPELLAAAVHPLVTGDADAAFGPAQDGGFWLLGLRRPDPGLVVGVPMSAADTGEIQLMRLKRAGLRVHLMPELTDVDTLDDAIGVAREVPGSRFAAALNDVLPACGVPLSAAPVGAA